jgi:regulator of sirC expression with transglutaminase-like and TPR domain
MQIRDLAELATTNVEEAPLEEIAFLVAREKYADLDVQPYRERLDEFARRARLRIGNVVGGRQIAEGLSHYLFEEEGFRGNTHDYYDPSNSFLNDVLDQREGIPITLSILYVAIGRRLELPVAGVSFPGHFLVRYDDPYGAFFVDPFYRGKLLSEQDCRQRLSDMYGDLLPFREEFLFPARHREVLLRLLANLKMIYMTKKDFPMALQILNRVLLFNPFGADEVKERGLIYYQMECFGQALKDLESYLTRSPTAPDRLVIEECIEDLKSKVAQIH